MARPKFPFTGKVIRDIPYKEIGLRLFTKPPGAPDFLPCKKCGAPLWIRWDQPFLSELAPIIDEQKQIMFPVNEMGIRCNRPHCGGEATLNFGAGAPPTQGFVTLYGDDAFRDKTSGFMCSYVFVGCGALDEPRLANALDAFKLAVQPQLDPNSWAFHCTDLRNERWRKKNNVQLSISAINEEMRKLAQFLAGLNKIVFVTTSDWGRKEEMDAIKDTTLAIALLAAAENMTEMGWAHKVIIESANNSASKSFMDYRVERVGRSLYLSPAFLYSCRGKRVDLPTTGHREISPQMQFADLVAYWIMRHLHRSSIGKPVEIKPEEFGELLWTHEWSGRWHYHRTIGCPFTVNAGQER